jgi:hypothetical protein
MKYSRLFKLMLFLVATSCATSKAGSGPGEAAGRLGAPRVDFKVLVWYRGDNPLETFKYQVYDVRKGEYSPAVDAWIERIRQKHQDYILMVRDVDLRRESGETESLKVGSVIKNELFVAAALSGIVMGGGTSLGAPLPFAGAGPTSTARPSTSPFKSDRPYVAPSPYPFPVPYPYPRPHP